LPAALVDVDLPEEGGFGTGRELAGSPPLVEKRQSQGAAAVADVDLGDALAPPAAPGVGPLHPGQHPRTAPWSQVADARLGRAVEPAPGIVLEEVEDGRDPRFLEGRGLAVTDAVDTCDRCLGQRSQRARHRRRAYVGRPSIERLFDAEKIRVERL